MSDRNTLEGRGRGLARLLAFHFLVTQLFVSVPASAAATASRYTEPFPVAASKKGIQVQMVDDALALGIQHATFNVNLTALADPRGDTNNPSWQFEGHTFRFQRRYLESLDRQIKALSDRGVVVYLILLTYASGDAELNRLMLHPRYDKSAPNKLGAFNTVTDDGRRWFTAMLEFLAERWSRPDRAHGRVAGYILGNEVNSHWWWSNMGRVTMTEFADDYLRTARLAHGAIRRQSSWARLYLSLEHHWSMRFPAGDERQSFPAREFLDYFARRAKEQGDFDWHVAFHPYPESLRNPRFWNDKTATPGADAKRVTFKNLGVLTAYLRRPELLHNDQPRRIILSEQGFDLPKTPDGEAVQAAAFCYAWKLIEQQDGIDAFILHRHVDHAREQGLRFGLWSNKPGSIAEPDRKRRIYECFRAADTPEWEGAFRFALPIVGLKSWDEVR
jgi:hypothetical protein